jgi:hypothetical protein
MNAYTEAYAILNPETAVEGDLVSYESAETIRLDVWHSIKDELKGRGLKLEDIGGAYEVTA